MLCDTQRFVGITHDAKSRRFASQLDVTISTSTNENGTVRNGAVLEVPRRGAELSHESPGKSQFDRQDDAESDAVCVVSDPWLARLIEVWPALADDVKGEMLTLAGLRPYDVDDFNDVNETTDAKGVTP